MRRRPQYAFSLIEVLVAVAIIALLAGILVPALSAARTEGRRAACLSNLRQLGVATTFYLDANRGFFWRELVRVTRDDKYEGDLWWFGFEPGGPPVDVVNTSDRPLDKRQGVIAKYLDSVDDALQCPAFPYHDGQFFPKFKGRSASYGYNSQLGPRNELLPLHRRSDHARETATMFVFADAVLYDFNTDHRFNEGYIMYPVPEFMMDKVPEMPSGYGHFRHNRLANVLYLDTHVEPQPLRGLAFKTNARGGGPAGLLTSPAGKTTIYGKEIR